jgi:hypothetical protein
MARAKSSTAAGEKKTTTRAKKTAVPTNDHTNGKGVELVNIEERIRVRAYELYVTRGRQHGAHENDWFAAEAELRSHTA